MEDSPNQIKNFSSTSVPFLADVNDNKKISVSKVSDKGLPIRSSAVTSTDVKYLDTQPSVSDDSIKNPPDFRQEEGRKKAVIFGKIGTPATSSFILMFESAPVWFLSLDQHFVRCLCFPQFNNESSLVFFLTSHGFISFLNVYETFDKDLVHFGYNYKTHLIQPSLTLVSGSQSFFDAFLTDSALSRIPYLYIMDKYFRCRKLPHPSMSRIRHVDHGGPTSFETIWTASPTLLVPPSPLERHISSFVDYGTKPTSSSTGLPQFMVRSVFPIQALSAPIHFETSFCSSGYGTRTFTQSELCHVFGIPVRYHELCLTLSFPIVPVQILDSLLRTALQERTALAPSRDTMRVPLPVPDDAPVFLPLLGKCLPSTWSKSLSVSQKATKDDDARVELAKWDLRVSALWPGSTPSFPILRAFLLRIAKRRLFLEFRDFLVATHEEAYSRYIRSRFSQYAKRFSKQLGGWSCTSKRRSTYVSTPLLASKSKRFFKDLKAGRHILSCYMRSSFFGWDGGSTLIYWRWPERLRLTAITGFPIQIQTQLPSSFQRMSKPKEPMFSQLLSKISKGIDRSYLVPTPSNQVNSLIQYFGVPKGPTDIRMVQNGTSCGLNEAVWASNFWLPTPKSMTRSLGYNYKAVDIDLGEMFLNFPLDEKLIPYSGMDASPFREELSQMFQFKPDSHSKRLYLTCTRCWMGFRPSPELACRFYYLAEEFVRGNRLEKTNPLRWDSIVLNLMGNSNFNPALPNVFKWNDHVKRMAGDLKAYVDDLRTIGWSLEHAWAIAHRVAARLQYLGIQDAPRKRRIDNGPWAGAIYTATDTLIQKTVSQEKWDKGKSYIDQLNAILNHDKDSLISYKLLEKIRGFLCHLAMTFDLIFPFLKGFHLSLCSHLPNRNEEGWKIKDLEWVGMLEQMREQGKMSDEEVREALDFKYDPNSHPDEIKVVPRFHSCLTALTKFFNLQSPPIVTERSNNIHLLIYGFADASKSGFGASMQYDDNIRYRIGTWGADEDNSSSNFREFANVVETLEDEFNSNRLKDALVILATDNSTVECALYKGNSSSERLFDLVVRLKDLELKSGSKFIITHVSGERMKAQGTDGISRGQLREGVSLGQAMLHFCPWGLSVLDRSTTFLKWMKGLVGNHLEPLTPEGWFTRAHDLSGGKVDDKGFWRHNIKPGTYLWTPPPAAADAALEQLRIARLKRRKSSHIVAVPRLATSTWLKQLNKAADIVLTIPARYSFWTTNMFEPVVIAFLFPYLPFRPWQIRSTPKLLAFGREMQKMFREKEVDPSYLLHKFYRSSTRLPTLSLDVVSKVLYFGQRS